MQENGFPRMCSRVTQSAIGHDIQYRLLVWDHSSKGVGRLSYTFYCISQMLRIQFCVFIGGCNDDVTYRTHYFLTGDEGKYTFFTFEHCRGGRGLVWYN